MLARYAGFHQMMPTAGGAAIDFYKALGFERAGKTEPMWIYAGSEHQEHYRVHARGRLSALELDDDKIFVNDGPMWTSAGMTACIDLAIALVEAGLGTAVAKAVARKMVVYHRRTGGQSQFSSLAEMDGGSDRIRLALRYAKENLHTPLSVEQLAEHVNWSPRHFSRAFVRTLGKPPQAVLREARQHVGYDLL